MLDWIVREGGYIVSWWLLTTLAGAAALPACARLLGGLPDRGYTLARAAGLLFVGFVFWLLASFGFVGNNTGSMALAWLIVLLGSLWVGRGAARDWRAWWGEQRRLVVVSEVLFLVLFAAWALYRAHQNALVGTEKPMELMFMNSVVRSEAFPPNDAWLAGYAISYYYFGYVLSAMLIMLSGVPTTLGFNLMIALLFALTGLGAFGVVYNLVAARQRSRAAPAADDAGVIADRTSFSSTPILTGLLGMTLLVLVGNLQLPLVEAPYQARMADAGYLGFWNVDQRQQPLDAQVGGTGSLDPANWEHWWWFRASRVVNDLDVREQHIEVIDEFPAFSFLLADVHPHVLALPFVLLALGAALSLVVRGAPPDWRDLGFYGVLIGGLIFLNTWDGIYLLALVGAEALRRLRQHAGRLVWGDWRALVGLGAGVLALAGVLYLPFWLGFRSQAGGVLPNLINPTSTPQFFLMFGGLLLLLAPFLIAEAGRAARTMHWSLALVVAGAVAAAALVFLAAVVIVAANVPEVRETLLRYMAESGMTFDAALRLMLARRGATILTTLLLLAGIGLVIGRLFPRGDKRSADGARRVTYSASTGYALLLIGIGLVLTLTPEFIYLRDNFGTRMNTIFKFYYQAWTVWSIAAAYGVYTLMSETDRSPAPIVRGAMAALLVVVLTLGLAYPVMGVYTRAFVESGRLYAAAPAALTLDGGTTFVSADDYNAIQCFDRLVQDERDVVVAEAVGPAYRSEFGRVAALTGVPILLGWENHQGQWRGATYGTVVGTRPNDVPTLYREPRWDVARLIIDRYGIDYIFFGQSERSAYGAGAEEKFRDRLEIVCEAGNSRFYRVSSAVVQGQ